MYSASFGWHCIENAGTKSATTSTVTAHVFMHGECRIDQPFDRSLLGDSTNAQTSLLFLWTKTNHWNCCWMSRGSDSSHWKGTKCLKCHLGYTKLSKLVIILVRVVTPAFQQMTILQSLLQMLQRSKQFENIFNVDWLSKRIQSVEDNWGRSSCK
jgi:hypothetical protein